MKRLLTAKEAAIYLCICEKSVYDLVNAGKLNPVRLAKKAVRYDIQDLDNFIEASKHSNKARR